MDCLEIPPLPQDSRAASPHKNSHCSLLQCLLPETEAPNENHHHHRRRGERRITLSLGRSPFHI
ncbi:hypothetical protein HYC85_025341 [Camellia sinensis]|uniref:Uncharacterized protein n=1 Tax=Camellia sinensis TaxID=4442 RepID=A0A7J7GC16_CAMSI|nr:hypothetical protein HYC85_025341 [Camellia sinensis]